MTLEQASEILTVSTGHADDTLVRVAVSLALAQSTRISVQETQVMEMVYSTKELPFQLVKTGSVTVPHDELAILIGKVFLQKSALNLQVCYPRYALTLTLLLRFTLRTDACTPPLPHQIRNPPALRETAGPQAVVYMHHGAAACPTCMHHSCHLFGLCLEACGLKESGAYIR
jgi:hypothetical protein